MQAEKRRAPRAPKARQAPAKGQELCVSFYSFRAQNAAAISNTEFLSICISFKVYALKFHKREQGQRSACFRCLYAIAQAHRLRPSPQGETLGIPGAWPIQDRAWQCR